MFIDLLSMAYIAKRTQEIMLKINDGTATEEEIREFSELVKQLGGLLDK